MKKFITILLIWCILASICGVAQNVDSSTKEKNKYRNPESPVDNISYWMEMAREGIVPYNASIPFKPAEYINSRVKGDPIDQMSTDVCVWNETGVTQSENSVFVDPDNAQYILNSNNSESGGSIYGANYIISSNAGQAWSGSKFGAGGSNSGDPATAIGRNGRHYVGYITNSAGQGVAWSDNGTTWNPVTIATITAGPDNLLDKNHMMIDTRASGTYSGYLYSSWTRFQPGHTNDTDIEFSRSTTNGLSWSAAINISNAIAAGSHNQGVNIQTGPNGEVYCVWAVYDDWGAGLYEEDAIGFAKSTNGGSSFAAATRIHNNIKGTRSWNPVNDAGKNMRINSFPSMAVDISGGSYSGYIYVVWANMGVPGTNTGTNVSVYCMRSTNGGTSWGTPVRVNQFYAADYASFFPWITCDPVTGRLFCIFYDDRSLGSTSTACQVWCAVSEDAGVSWIDFRVGDVSFTPAPMAGLAGGYFGDYLGITARDGWVYPCWTDNRSGRALTYVSPIHFTDYCIATGGCTEHISNVSIGSINNSSACEGYQNFTNLSTSIPVNSSAALTVTNGVPFGSDQCGVWVDWNNDGDFVDAGETITVAVTPGTGPYTATIAPPVGTALGTKIMRIRIMYTGTLSSCGNTTYGEVEDYSINVSAMVPNVWDGSFNHYWHNDNNWSLGHIPTSTEEVTIPNVGYQPVYVDFYDEACANLNIATGTVLNIYDQTLTVNGILTIDGQLGMLQDNAYINAMSNVIWNSGSTLNVTATNCFINVYGNWNYNPGSNVNPAMGFVDFEGATDCWIRSYSPTSSFYNMRIYKSGGAAAKFSNASSNDLVVNNLTFITTGGIFQSFSNYNIVMRGYFNYYGTFDFTQLSNTGSIIFDGTSQSINNYSSGSGIFNNVVFSSSTGTMIAGGDIVVAKDLTINQGYFNSGSVGVTIGGNWTNTVGTTGYVPGTTTVLFHSQTGASQDVNGTNNFYNIIQDNTGQYLRFNDDNTILSNLELHYFCWAYQTLNINGILNIDDVASKFTANGPDGNATIGTLNQGGKLVSNGGGMITVNDLVENGLFGSYYVNSTSDFMQITNSGTGTYVDLAADLHILGGTMKINGTISWWPYGGNATIEMTGGVLDLTGCGIYINNNLSLIHSITGGTIRTIGGFSGNRADFTPTAGTFEFYGSSDATISQSNGCTLWNVNVNKSAKDLSFTEPPISAEAERIDNTYIKGGKANAVSLASNFVINGGLIVSAGTLNIGAYTCSAAGDANVYGSLSMTNAAGVLNVGTYQYDNLWFKPGSTGNLDAGNIYLKSWIAVEAGATFTASTNNTIHIIGSNMGGGLGSDEPSALFGNININKTANPSYLTSTYNSIYNIQGSFTVQPGNSFQITGNNSLHVNGILTDASTSSIYLYYASKDDNSITSLTPSLSEKSLTDNSLLSGSKGGGLTIETDFTLNGLMDVADGNVLLHGIFHLASTGNLNITSGSFIADGPNFDKNWEYLDGHLGLTSGLFEISHNSIQFSATGTSTVSGGIIRSGEAFAALNVGNFQPSGGTLEMVGVGSNTIYCDNGNYFYNLLINRDPAAESWLFTNITVNNNLTVNSGTLFFNTLTASVLGGVTLNGGNLLVNNNANLLLAGSTILNVNNGGKLSVIGALGTPGKVSRISTGYYAFKVQSGGTIAAQYGIFEYMDLFGIYLYPGSLVDPVNSFNNCTFRYQNPVASSSLFTIGGTQVFTASNTSFPVNTGAGTYNVWKYDNAGDITFFNASGAFAGPEFEYDPYSHVQWTMTPYNVSLTVFLEGPFNTSTNLMNTSINTLLPLGQPYGTPPPGNPTPDWLYTGTESVGSIPSASIVDWVEVQLRDATTAAGALPARVIARKVGFLLNTGVVVGLDGLNPLSFNSYFGHNLYAVVWHRNHLGVLSANSLTPAGGGYSYNFSSGAGQAYTTGVPAQKLLATGIYGMKSGDGTGNGLVETTDKTIVWSTQAGKTGYREGDYNMNKQVNNPDKDDKWLPNLGSGSFIPE